MCSLTQARIELRILERLGPRVELRLRREVEALQLPSHFVVRSSDEPGVGACAVTQQVSHRLPHRRVVLLRRLLLGGEAADVHLLAAQTQLPASPRGLG